MIRSSHSHENKTTTYKTKYPGISCFLKKICGNEFQDKELLEISLFKSGQVSLSVVSLEYEALMHVKGLIYEQYRC